MRIDTGIRKASFYHSPAYVCECKGVMVVDSGPNGKGICFCVTDGCPRKGIRCELQCGGQVELHEYQNPSSR